MPGDYRSQGDARLCGRPPSHQGTGRCEHNDEPGARLFLCAFPPCRTQVWICCRCDRGQVYCPDCAPQARRRSLIEAGRRYQQTLRGRIMHAAREGRYRARKNNVTHQGSPPYRPDDLLAMDPAVSEPSPADSPRPSRLQRGHCMRCGRRCSKHVRLDHLRRRIRRDKRIRGPEDDHSP